MPYVYSTLTSGSLYCDYVKNDPRQDAIILKRVEIKGGHGVATTFKNSNFQQVHTPVGVATFVSDEDLEFLLANDGFQEHMERGFITHDKKEVKAEVKAQSMTQRDKSAPLTTEHLTPGELSEEGMPIYKGKK